MVYLMLLAIVLIFLSYKSYKLILKTKRKIFIFLSGLALFSGLNVIEIILKMI